MEKMNANEVYIRLKKKEPLIVGDKVFISAFDYELSEKDLEKAARELGETDEKREICIRKLKEKISSNLLCILTFILPYILKFESYLLKTMY